MIRRKYKVTKYELDGAFVVEQETYFWTLRGARQFSNILHLAQDNLMTWVGYRDDHIPTSTFGNIYNILSRMNDGRFLQPLPETIKLDSLEKK